MPEKRITLPESKDGYYRFGDLPRLIADSDLPQQWPDDDSEGMRLALHELRTIEAVKTRLQAAVENGNFPVVDFAYQPLEWAQGAALDSALVHIDWLNEWGAHQSIAYVFTIATPETPQKETLKQRRAQLLQELEAEEVPQAAAPEQEAPKGPLALTTGDIAFCFDGLRWNEKQWRKPLGYPPKWLRSCMVSPGQRGVREATWNPVSIAGRLVKDDYVKARSARARFQTKPQLAPWLEVWKTYEADYLDND